MAQIFACDFETNNHENDCRVWCWGAVEVNSRIKETDEIIKGYNIKEFYTWIMNSTKIIYFHNLKFDATFLLSYLLSNGWTYFKGEDKKDMKSKQFDTLINDMGIIYQINLRYKRYKISLRDSYKLLPYKLDDIGKFLGMDIQKGSIDYNLFRSKHYMPTADEWEYLRKDVVILGLALQALFNDNITKLTMSSQTLHDYKTHLAVHQRLDFDNYFPTLTEHEYDYILDSYVGGLVMVNEKHRGKVMKNVKVYDENSEYPAKLSFEFMPFGDGQYFEGEPPKDKLFVVKFTCKFRLKKGQLPWVRIRNNRLYKANRTQEMSIGLVELTMCSVDLEQFFLHYHVTDITYQGGYYYKRSKNLFASYIDTNNQKKIANNDNEFKRNLYKLRNNGLYGKFGMKTKMKLKEPYLDEEGVLKYKIYKEETNDGVYLPVAIFTTAYARRDLLICIRQLGNKFIYCDTDSIHTTGSCAYIEENLHPTELGKWDNEFNATKAKYLGAKLYLMEGTDGKGRFKKKVVGAGMTPEIKAQITFDNFEIGSSFTGARKSKNVKGGVVIQDTTFAIFERGYR